MAHIAPLLPSFARGEISPLMYGRTDIQQYNTCLEKCRNMWIRPYGCASRLTGTEYINTAKNNGKARLLKFVFSASDSYIIECGAGYFRFYRNGKPVLQETAQQWESNKEYIKGDYVISNDEMYYCEIEHTSNLFNEDLISNYWTKQNEYEIPNTYTVEQLESIQYVQLDDIMKLTCLPVGDDYTTAKPKELLRYASNKWVFRDVEFKETPYLDQNITDIKLTPSAVTGDITITASADFFNKKQEGANFWIGLKVLDEEENKEKQGFVKITEFVDAKKVKATVLSKLSGTTATAIWGEGAFSDYRGYPAVVALYDGRLYYARTSHQPRNIYGSVPYAYEKFTPAVDNEDDGAINIELATNATGDGSDIKWLIGSSYLLCGTYGGEFIIRGTGDGAITPTDISARQRTNWGGEPVQPIVAGSFVHYIQRNGKKLRQFQYDYIYDGYKAVDTSIFSEHLLSSPIKQMAFQKTPDSILYLLREDGNVVLVTFEQDQSIMAWSLLEEMNGQIESIETIPSVDGNYDEVYLLMRREGLNTELTANCSNSSLKINKFYNKTKPKLGKEVYNFVYSDTYPYFSSLPFDGTYIKVGNYCDINGNTLIDNLKNITSIRESAIIADGKLYLYRNDIYTQVGTDNNWVSASGYLDGGNYGIIANNAEKGICLIFEDINNAIRYKYANKNYGINCQVFGLDVNKRGFILSESKSLYCAERNWNGYDSTLSIDVIPLLSNCTEVSINTKNSNGYAISNGSLYKISYGVSKKIGSYTNWQNVVSFGINTVGLGIRNNDLYFINGTTTTLIKTNFDVVKLPNTCNDGDFQQSPALSFFAIGVNCLLRIGFDNAGKPICEKLFDGNFTDVQGYCLYDVQRAIVVLDNDIYKIVQHLSEDATTITGIDLVYVGPADSSWLDENGKETNLKEYGITVEGKPNKDDTLTLTYTTELANENRSIECMKNPITQENQNNWWYVRSGKEYNSFNATLNNDLTVSIQEDKTVVLTSEKDFFTTEAINKSFRVIDKEYNIQFEGTISQFNSSKEVVATIELGEVKNSVKGGLWGLGETLFTNLEHLNEKEVQVFADGLFIGVKTVEDNQLELVKPCYKVLIGLPYQSYMTTMPIEQGSQNGTAVGKRKRIGELSLRVWNSLGVRYGRDLDNLFDTIQNQTNSYTGVIPNIKYNQGWGWVANVTLEQSKPYPMNVLAIAPILTEVDK